WYEKAAARGDVEAQGLVEQLARGEVDGVRQQVDVSKCWIDEEESQKEEGVRDFP
ncbi:MAG: hypothetical protein HQL56_18600, partial [Magnetococcales bacterium]|nr:hypothetical protein [Magnetococcales bacterium]